MSNRKKKWMLGALIMLALSPLMWRGIEAYDYANSDGITRAGIDTSRVIARYERSGDASEIRAWIVNTPGAALTTQCDMTIGHWAQENPAKFAAVIEGMTEQERAVFFEHFFSESNLDDISNFQLAFRGQQSPAIAHITRNRSYQ